jgi:O-antigen ligase
MVRLANLIFLGLVVAVTLAPALRRRLQWDLGLTTLAAIVLLTSMVQALAIGVENARYAIPVQPLVIIIVLCAVLRFVARHGISADNSKAEKRNMK